MLRFWKCYNVYNYLVFFVFDDVFNFVNNKVIFFCIIVVDIIYKVVLCILMLRERERERVVVVIV